MRLADDSRGRVPFALIAALLLVSSAAFASSLSGRDPVKPNRATDEAVDRVTATTRATVRSAVSEAARDAAREPVTAPADTPPGRVLNDSRTFRDALRVRIYLAARERLAATQHRHQGVTVSASLPPTPNASALRAAKRRVVVDGVDNGTALRVRLRNVSLTARRDDGTVVARERETYRVTVATPVLAMHDRTRRFQARLRRGPVEGSGLGRQLTARLYPIAWTRGAAQYAGLPVQNVVANRHVALATNGGVLAVQRASFGRVDPEGRQTYRRAAVTRTAQDAFAVTSTPGERALAALTRSRSPLDPEPDRTRRPPTDATALDSADRPSPEDDVTVGVNRSAESALLALVDPSSNLDADTNLQSLLRGAYRGRATLQTRTDLIRREEPPARDPPDENWTLIASERDRRTVVEPASEPLPNPASGRTLLAYARRVIQRSEVTRTWRNGNRTRRSTAQWQTVHRVGVAVVGRHAPEADAPDRPVRPLFRRGGAVDGSNLAGVPPEARRRLIVRQGGRDAVAERAAAGSLRTRSVTVDGRRPSGLRRWVLTDLVALHRQVRNVSVTVSKGAIASGRANPSARLAAALRTRRTDLLSVPDRYHGVADWARVAARAAYLDAVIARLEERAERRRAANEQLGSAVQEAGAGSRRHASEVLSSRRRASSASRHSLGTGPPAGNVTLVPDGDPAYLTLSAVDRRRAPAVSDGQSYQPLAARNLNLFTVPYGDAVDAVVGDGEQQDTRQVGLQQAGRVLVAANRTLANRSNRSLRRRRDALTDETVRAMTPVRRRARTVLRERAGLGRREAAVAVESAADRWDGVGARAIAVSNGSFADAVAATATTAADLSPTRTAVLRSRLRVALGRTVRETGATGEAARVERSAVDQAAERTSSVARTALKKALKSGAGNLTETAAAERAFGDRFGGVPAGLPLLPAPGYWIATVNVWHVQVRGAYARFAVRARSAGGGALDGATYVRDGSTVRLDVDGDGERERVGRNERVRFRTETVVVIAVPPSGRGVGDIDGNADERSPAWPCPGVVSATDSSEPCSSRGPSNASAATPETAPVASRSGE